MPITEVPPNSKAHHIQADSKADPPPPHISTLSLVADGEKMTAEFYGYTKGDGKCDRKGTAEFTGNYLTATLQGTYRVVVSNLYVHQMFSVQVFDDRKDPTKELWGAMSSSGKEFEGTWYITFP